MGKATTVAEGLYQAIGAPTAQADAADQAEGGTVLVSTGRSLFRIKPVKMLDVAHNLNVTALVRMVCTLEHIRAGSHDPATAEDLQKHDHEGDDQQDVNQTAHGRRGDEPEQPQNQEHDGNGI